MIVDRERFLRDGYLIVPGCIPPDQLESLRGSFETLVDRQRKIWVRARREGDPPGGAWETAPQPRLFYDEVVDAATADTVEFLLHENTRGVSRQLLQAEEAAVLALFLMCSPQRDHGPAKWHRDLHPFDQAPVAGLQADLVENAPAGVQWNVPLYDDDVLWVVPGSHRRLNTVAENEQLAADDRVPLPNGIPVELKAGDGVVYSNIILHWGSNYSARLRRTINFGYRGFGGPSYPYVSQFYWTAGFGRDLSPATRAAFDRFESLFQAELRRIVAFFKAVIARDETSFRRELEALHPGEKARVGCLVLLSKLARKICLQEQDFGYDLKRADEVRRHFDEGELSARWKRFALLDSWLQSEDLQVGQGLQREPNRYYYDDIPASVGIDEFIANWS